MVLLAGGLRMDGGTPDARAVELPPKKLVELTSALHHALQTSAKAPFSSIPITPVDGSDEHTHMVCQGECSVRFVTAATCVAAAEAWSGASESILSTDATTCAIVAFRVVTEEHRVVSLAHFYSSQQVADSLDQVVRLATVFAGSRARDEREPVAVYVVGSVMERKFALPLLQSLFLKLVNDVRIYTLVPEGCCFWDANTDRSTGRCLIRGLQVDVATGRARPVERVTRDFPCFPLRSLRSFAENPPLVAICPDPSTEPAQWAEYLRAPNTLVIRAFQWRPLPPHTLAFTDEEILRSFSTTPTMEPPDFAACFRGAVVESAKRPRDVFGHPPHPIWLKRVSANHWEPQSTP